jgi:hypothetical protein
VEGTKAQVAATVSSTEVPHPAPQSSSKGKVQSSGQAEDKDHLVVEHSSLSQRSDAMQKIQRDKIQDSPVSIQETTNEEKVTTAILHPEAFAMECEKQRKVHDNVKDAEEDAESCTAEGGDNVSHLHYKRLPTAKDLQRSHHDVVGYKELGPLEVEQQDPPECEPHNHLDSLTFLPQKLDSPGYPPSSTLLSVTVAVDSADGKGATPGANAPDMLLPLGDNDGESPRLQEESSRQRLRTSTSFLLCVEKSHDIREQIESGMKEEDEIRSASLRRDVTLSQPGVSVVGVVESGRLSQLDTQSLLPLPAVPGATAEPGGIAVPHVPHVPHEADRSPFREQSMTAFRDPEGVFVELAVIVRQLLGMVR